MPVLLQGTGVTDRHKHLLKLCVVLINKKNTAHNCCVKRESQGTDRADFQLLRNIFTFEEKFPQRNLYKCIEQVRCVSILGPEMGFKWGNLGTGSSSYNPSVPKATPSLCQNPLEFPRCAKSDLNTLHNVAETICRG